MGLDSTSRGGGRYTSGIVMHDAADSRGSGPVRTSLEEVLEAMPNIGDVNVSRAGPDAQGGYEWTVTFDPSFGDIPQLFIAQSGLESIGAAIDVQTLRDGAMLGGHFRLSYEGEQTEAIPVDATEGQVKDALQALVTIDSVNVRSVPPPAVAPILPAAFASQVAAASAGLQGPIGERAWEIKFTSDFNKGQLESLVTSSLLVQGLNGEAVVCRNGSAVSPCQGLSVLGNLIGGTF